MHHVADKDFWGWERVEVGGQPTANSDKDRVSLESRRDAHSQNTEYRWFKFGHKDIWPSSKLSGFILQHEMSKLWFPQMEQGVLPKE